MKAIAEDIETLGAKAVPDLEKHLSNPATSYESQKLAIALLETTQSLDAAKVLRAFIRGRLSELEQGSSRGSSPGSSQSDAANSSDGKAVERLAFSSLGKISETVTQAHTFRLELAWEWLKGGSCTPELLKSGLGLLKSTEDTTTINTQLEAMESDCLAIEGRVLESIEEAKLVRTFEHLGVLETAGRLGVSGAQTRIADSWLSYEHSPQSLKMAAIGYHAEHPSRDGINKLEVFIFHEMRPQEEGQPETVPQSASDEVKEATRVVTRNIKELNLESDLTEELTFDGTNRRHGCREPGPPDLQGAALQGDFVLMRLRKLMEAGPLSRFGWDPGFIEDFVSRVTYWRPPRNAGREKPVKIVVLEAIARGDFIKEVPSSVDTAIQALRRELGDGRLRDEVLKGLIVTEANNPLVQQKASAMMARLGNAGREALVEIGLKPKSEMAGRWAVYGLAMEALETLPQAGDETADSKPHVQTCLEKIVGETRSPGTAQLGVQWLGLTGKEGAFDTLREAALSAKWIEVADTSLCTIVRECSGAGRSFVRQLADDAIEVESTYPLRKLAGLIIEGAAADYGDSQVIGNQQERREATLALKELGLVAADAPALTQDEVLCALKHRMRSAVELEDAERAVWGLALHWGEEGHTAIRELAEELATGVYSADRLELFGNTAALIEPDYERELEIWGEPELETSQAAIAFLRGMARELGNKVENDPMQPNKEKEAQAFAASNQDLDELVRSESPDLARLGELAQALGPVAVSRIGSISQTSEAKSEQQLGVLRALRQTDCAAGRVALERLGSETARATLTWEHKARAFEVLRTLEQEDLLNHQASVESNGALHTLLSSFTREDFDALGSLNDSDLEALVQFAESPNLSGNGSGTVVDDDAHCHAVSYIIAQTLPNETDIAVRVVQSGAPAISRFTANAMLKHRAPSGALGIPANSFRTLVEASAGADTHLKQIALCCEDAEIATIAYEGINSGSAGAKGRTEIIEHFRQKATSGTLAEQAVATDVLKRLKIVLNPIERAYDFFRFTVASWFGRGSQK
ncbi:hypothetical protein OAO01_06875 [Oligoflexia bacterium]|nr:hypothetical protein [Oligoflexia bacterium]